MTTRVACTRDMLPKEVIIASWRFVTPLGDGPGTACRAPTGGRGRPSSTYLSALPIKARLGHVTATTAQGVSILG